MKKISVLLIVLFLSISLKSQKTVQIFLLEQYSPNTILPNNSKALVLVNFGVGYNVEL